MKSKGKNVKENLCYILYNKKYRLVLKSRDKLQL